MLVPDNILERIGRRKLVVIAGALAVVGVAAGWMAVHPAAPSTPAPVGTVDPPAASSVLVFVSGAVAHPGLYQLSPDARVADAIAAAGGMTSQANPGKLPNMAARVHDGRQVNVPFMTGSSATTTAKLDINTAAQDELESVPGMPPGLAAAIVQYRDEWGPFATLSQLHSELGVDSGTVGELGHYLRVILPPV